MHMHRLEDLRTLVRQGNSDAFAKELNLDPGRTREWFDHGLTQEGYGADVVRALGAHVLRALTTTHDGGEAHG